MARPAKFDRREALEAVTDEIWRSGYGACSAKAISEKLGITRSSFYNAFDSREALFKEALDAYDASSPDKLLAEADGGEKLPKLLTRLFREVCKVRAADPEARGCMAVNSVAELVGVDPELGPYLEQMMLAKLRQLETLLRRAANRGEIEDDGNLKAKALALFSLLAGLNVMAKVVHSEKELWGAAKAGLKGLGLYSR